MDAAVRTMPSLLPAPEASPKQGAFPPTAFCGAAITGTTPPSDSRWAPRAFAIGLYTRSLLDRLSPARALPAVRARAILVHGYADPTIPYTESLRLAAARPAGTTVILVHGIAHVEGTRPTAWTLAGEVSRLWLALHTLAHPG